MTTWTDADLCRFGDAEDVRVAGMRRDGSLRIPVIVWVVRVSDDLYTRSVNGPDAAYQRKYHRYPGPFRSITSPVARSTTLKLVPHQQD